MSVQASDLNRSDTIFPSPPDHSKFLQTMKTTKELFEDIACELEKGKRDLLNSFNSAEASFRLIVYCKYFKLSCREIFEEQKEFLLFWNKMVSSFTSDPDGDSLKAQALRLTVKDIEAIKFFQL